MGPHERRGDLDGLVCAQRLDYAQHSQLGFGVEPVSALRLTGGRARRQHFCQPRARRSRQLIRRGGAGGLHGGENPAARCRNLRIRGARQAAAQLLTPVAGKDDVRVRVDEPGHERSSPAVDAPRVRVRAHLAQDVGGRASRKNGRPVTCDGGVGDRRDVGLPRAGPRCGTRDGVQLVEVLDQERGGQGTDDINRKSGIAFFQSL